MSESVILGILSLLVMVLLAAIGGLYKAQVAHDKDCRDWRTAQSATTAMLQEQVRQLEAEVGDHDNGIRGSLHELRNQISPMMLYYQLLKERRQ